MNRAGLSDKEMDRVAGPKRVKKYFETETQIQKVRKYFEAAEFTKL